MRLQRPDKAQGMQEVQETETSARSAAALSLPARQEDVSGIHTSVCVSIRQHTSAYVSIRQHTSAYASIRQHTPAYVSILIAPCASESRDRLMLSL
jgi:hypothetical protein